MLLQNLNAIIYGGAGAAGSVVAKAFAAEGAHAFLAGRTKLRLMPLLKQPGMQMDLQIQRLLMQPMSKR